MAEGRWRKGESAGAHSEAATSVGDIRASMRGFQAGDAVRGWRRTHGASESAALMRVRACVRACARAFVFVYVRAR
eukprot:2084252-Pleurochrysis_carterae.AAC.2